MLLKSPAKINLFLNIVKKRNDGFHNIETYFQIISLYDEIILNIIPGAKIDFTSDNTFMSCDDNLCVRAAELLRNYVEGGVNPNASIRLLKNIPVGGGLGGGSSNAAFVLLGLNELWKCNLKKK